VVFACSATAERQRRRQVPLTAGPRIAIALARRSV